VGRSGPSAGSGPVRVGGSVWDRLGSGPRRFSPQFCAVHGLVRSMGPHGTSRHGPFSGERRTSPPMDRTEVRHKIGTDSIMVQSDPIHGHRSIQNELDRPAYFKPLVTSEFTL
jgi:hypothetical protein